MKTFIHTLKAIILIAGIITLSSLAGFAGERPANLQRDAAAGFSIGTKGYIGTGEANNTKAPYWKDFWEYDPLTDSWTQKADFGGTARAYAVGFSIGSLGYLGTGLNASGDLQDFWQYDPSKNKWTQKANFGGVARCCATGFSIGSKGYVGTGHGWPGGVLTNLIDFWAYDPATNTWTQKANFIGAGRYAAAGFSIAAKGYLGAGINWVSSSSYTWYKDFYEYDPGTNVWTRKADFGGTARAFAVGFSINSTKGYIGTGNTGTSNEGFKNDFWEYDPANPETGGTWTKKADFGGTPRDVPAGFSIGKNGFIGTGYLRDGSYVQDFWEYNQSTNTWTQKTDLGGKHTGNLKEGDSQAEILADNNNSKLIVYPNPSASTFNFRLKTVSEEPVNIKIFDMTGRLVHEYSSLSPDEIITVGETMEAGIYVAVLTQGKYRKTVKLQKVN
jgi:N-acetylneuraminic acid mutarotase